MDNKKAKKSKIKDIMDWLEVSEKSVITIILIDY